MKIEILVAFSVALAGMAFFEPTLAMGSLPVPVESVTGCVRNGKILLQAPERFGHEKPLQINPCGNIPFDFAGSEGKQIRATGGIDLYNGAFVCPRDVTVIGDCPSETETFLKDQNIRPRKLSEEEAEKIVWDLPEVKAHAARLKGTKARLFTMITGAPDTEAKPGESTAAYEVYVGEDQGTHTVRVMTVLVDACDGKISLYDVVTDRVIPLEEYRKQVER